jgi:transcriptional regulator with XRE-family HTH domain
VNIPLKIAIIASGKKQRQIAQLADLTEQKLSDFVNDAARPTSEQRARLAAILNRPESILFGNGTEVRVELRSVR